MRISAEFERGRHTCASKMVRTKKEALTPRHRPPLATRNKAISKVLSRPVSSAVPAPTAANIRVVVRVRPPNNKEQGDNCRNVVKVVDEQMLIFDPKEDDQPFFYHGVQQRGRDLNKRANKDLTFVFDKVYNNMSTNMEVFQSTTQTLIGTLMDGYNCSVFAYGATGAGKTFTMIGSADSPGITYLTMKELFKCKDTLSAEREFELMLTYIEVYNELVKDLLNPGPPLNLREDSKYGVMIPGVKGYKITSPEELFALLEQGNHRRTQHPTDANAESSRSHAVFQVYIQMTIKTTREVRRAKLSMIDLAGSERGSATGFVGARFKEGANINKSLLALGNCINNLADGHRHIPYRDSKLTRLLKDSLGGNCHTIMIANVSPSSMSFDDTYNTLKYATRAKKIKSTIKRNVVNVDMHFDQYIKLVEDLQTENASLKAEIAALKSDLDRVASQLSDGARPQEEGPPTPPPPSDLLPQIELLFDEKKQILEREYQMRSSELGMSLRRKLKEETNRRLSDLHVISPEKDEAHRRLTRVVERFVKKEDATKNELALIQTAKREVDDKIQAYLDEHPELSALVATANLEIASVDYKYKWELSQKETKILWDEHRNKDALLEKISSLVKPMYLNLLGRGDIPKAFVAEYDNLLLDFQGRKNMCWGDVESEEVAAVEGAAPGVKRKIGEQQGGSNASLDSTYSTMPTVPNSSPAGKQRAPLKTVGVHQLVAKGLKVGTSKRIAHATSPRKYPHVSPKMRENRALPATRRPPIGRLETAKTTFVTKSQTKAPLERPVFR
ncbi:kinesin-like protein KIF18A [Cylas formicarius]|uniref:kinesin-like protein KIF18A n=1 Tax=Cylas formicarius TaxID=197179 RepID=UPI00295844E3|nr:kinesin-like protein KIF18A [Cylas formicarius]